MPRTASFKRLAFCFDGTWNRLDASSGTNVVLTAESIAPVTHDGVTQLIYYDEGVGTGKFEALRGGVFGVGMLKNLSDAYRHLIFNYSPGDEIYVFGFSRGAYSARSFVGLLRNCGIVERRYASRIGEAIELYRSRDPEKGPDGEPSCVFRSKYCAHMCTSKAEDDWRVGTITDYVAGAAPQLRIEYVGVWDTVGALGIPSRYQLAGLVNKRYEFHDTRLSSTVKSARHAVAIDEHRLDFLPTLWTGLQELNAATIDNDPHYPAYQQQWFPGMHGAVGGGGDFRGLSDGALDWIWDGARRRGLVFDPSHGSMIHSLQPRHYDPLDNVDSSRVKGFGRIKRAIVDSLWRRADRPSGPDRIDDVAISARRRWKACPQSLPEKRRYRPPTLAKVDQVLDAQPPEAVPRFAPDDVDIVTVAPGDTLSKLARDRLDDIGRTDEIFALNRDKLDDPDKIYAGMTLRLPKAVQPGRRLDRRSASQFDRLGHRSGTREPNNGG